MADRGNKGHAPAATVRTCFQSIEEMYSRRVVEDGANLVCFGILFSVIFILIDVRFNKNHGLSIECTTGISSLSEAIHVRDESVSLSGFMYSAESGEAKV